MSWTPELVSSLQSLWNEGLPTTEIGRRLGMSKNAVIGKAHRLGLSGRPSPIRREARPARRFRSEEHTSELQSLMRISYAVFCLKKKTKQTTTNIPIIITQHITH